MRKVCFLNMIFGLFLLVTTGFAYSATKGSADDTILTKLLKAVENNDLDSFVADGDNQFKAGITKQMFEGVHGMFGPRLKKGYDVVPLGTLNQQGCQVYLKKLVFKDGGDDVLAKLILKNGKVSGFWFQ